jgi:hypothetical protein
MNNTIIDELIHQLDEYGADLIKLRFCVEGKEINIIVKDAIGDVTEED